MAKQLKLNVYRGKWGGRRPGSGRKRIHSAGVAHRIREKVTHRTPVHVNLKYRIQTRNKEALRILKRAILNARRKGLRILHYSLQSNHLHLILESQDNDVLTTGMRSLTVTLARGFKKGRVQLERYHLHVLRGLQETRNAIRYVLLNEQKHTGARILKRDGYSSLGTLIHAKRLAQREKLSLLIRKSEEIPPDPGVSFLAQKALHQLYT